MEYNEKLNLILLKIALSFPFLYAGISSILNPNAWIGYFPYWMRNIIPVGVLSLLFSIFELLLSVWILSGWKLFYSSLVSLIVILGIVVSNIGAFDIVFRDISMISIAIILMTIGYNRK